MRRFFAVVVVLGVVTSSAQALPPIPDYIKESFGDKPEYKAYLAAADAQKSKCASCHVPGQDKKAKGHALNDFGKAVHKHLDDKAFMAADKAGKEAADEKGKTEGKAKAKELFLASWNKAAAEKNAEGKAFGDLIKDGKIPGKND